jgi:membrane associated rhomboid family serine protease
MAEDEQGPDERAPQGPRHNPRDGSIDFTRYSLAQLEELQYGIDPANSPQDHQNLISEIQRRRQPEASGPQQPAETWTAGRFTPADGWRGWLQAKRSGSPLYGAGAIALDAQQVMLRGSQRTWLGVTEDAEVNLPLTDVRNVARDDALVRFEFRRRFRPWSRVEFRATTDAEAAALVARLPTQKTPGFERRWSELRGFNEQLSSVGRTPWITAAIVSANLLVFLSMALVQRRLWGFDIPFFIQWGANFGPLTVSGQWWRLLTSVFLHLNWLHLLLNMWAFWNVGRLTERLYGRWTFAFIYLTTGLLASLASITWNPARISVGASGAIFGVFGALLACLSHHRRHIPASLVKAHWFSTLAFVAFNLISGMQQAGVDNAAHVGGLTAGYALGWILMRPLDPASREHFPVGRALGAIALVATLCLGALWQIHGIGSQLTPPEQFVNANAWYARGEAANLRAWHDLAVRSQSGSISDAELADAFEQQILPFWESASDRLKKQAPSVAPAQQAFFAAVAEFVRLRLEWTHALINAGRTQDPQQAADLARLVAENDASQARLERIWLRANMDHRPQALANSPWVLAVRRLFTRHARECVHYPWAIPGGPTDSSQDGPAQRTAAACRAQNLFMSGAYRELDDWLTKAVAVRGDLPDGSSTLQGIEGGLTNLFDFGGLSTEELLGRTSDWRRAVRGSVHAELAEADIFNAWAWSVRGHGSANSVTQQGWALFRHRSEMAAAGLQEVAQLAKSQPEWYADSISVGLDLDRKPEALRELFDAGANVAADYLPLHRAMLRVLQPRWKGSYEKVDNFIRDQSIMHDDDRLMYARLYWVFADLEQDDRAIFTDGLAEWRIMRLGFEGLAQRYPRSDAVVNAFARFSCAAQDAEQYRKLRPQLDKRPSASVWSKDTTMASCDQWLRDTDRNAPVPRPPGL